MEMVGKILFMPTSASINQQKQCNITASKLNNGVFAKWLQGSRQLFPSQVNCLPDVILKHRIKRNKQTQRDRRAKILILQTLKLFLYNKDHQYCWNKKNALKMQKAWKFQIIELNIIDATDFMYLLKCT